METVDKTTVKHPEIKTLVRGVYDLQKLRIQMGNRIAANFRSKLGLEPSEKEEDDKEAANILKQLRSDHKLITSGIVDAKIDPKSFKAQGVISSFTEFALITEYLDLERVEEKQFDLLEKSLRGIPIYEEFLKKVRGIGPALAGVIISEMNPYRAKYPSSFIKYAGIDVAENGKGRSKKKEHLVKVKYKNKDGEEAEKDSITFNPFLKTKLVGVLSGSFLKSKSPYAEIYYAAKIRYENHETYKDTTKKHRHAMAIRKMLKIFLIDLHIKWRELEGLPVSQPYHETKLGLYHGQDVIQEDKNTLAE